MARENQGLQIALILFVMLTIILSVSTYLCYRAYDEANKGKEGALAAGSKIEQEARKSADQVDELKRLIGAAKTEPISAITDTFNADMKKYGTAYSEDSQFYRKLLEKMQNTIDEKGHALADAKAAIPQREDDYKARENARDLQLKEFREAREKADADKASEQAKFQEERDRKNREAEKLDADAKFARKEAKEMTDKVKVDLAAANTLIGKLKDLVTDQSDKLARVTSDKVGNPNGEITWVNQRNATVWLNLGRADSLARQVTFSVYPADVTDMTAKGAKKGGIEVTQILGDHLAEARVLDDDIANPIIPGDKIFTPLWNPGEKRHFALAGLMDLDGSGHSSLQAVLNLISINGGVVDCYVTDTGNIVGQIDINTNCLIVGTKPDEKSEKKVLDAFSKIKGEADQLRLQRIQLADLLQRMGWKNMSPVVRFGRGANPKDFRAKPDEGAAKKSTGNMSDVFKKRQPPKAPATAF
jgi:hypothetical protein